MVAEELARQYPDIHVVSDAIFLHDNKVATSAGVTAGIDLALALVEEDYGSALAMDVARMLVLYLRRPGGQSQFSAPLNAQIQAGRLFNNLHDWILENLNQPLSIEHLADRVAMSPRNFSRIFTSETGISPGKYVESLRLNRARELLESGDDALETIAGACGFVRAEQLRRVFLRRLRITPVEYRNHFNISGKGASS
jgi:transcriptional regulator GlxA family with amidase domain